MPYQNSTRNIILFRVYPDFMFYGTNFKIHGLKESLISCRENKYKTASQHKLKGFVGRALGIEAVSFFMGRKAAHKKDLADSPTASRRERPKNK